MPVAENGKFVSVHYTGTLDNGDIFDSSKDKQPLEFQMGQGNLIQGFESAVRGLNVDDSTKFTLTPAEAYGEKDESLVRSFARAEIPPDVDFEVGQNIVLQSPQGQHIPAVVSHMDDENITVDMNHPLAGQNLTFEVTVVAVNDAPTQTQGGCSECPPDCTC